MMDIDEPESETPAQKIQTLIPPLSSSLAKLSGSSRGIPFEKDFHFYNNFDEFSNPIHQIDQKSKNLLSKISKENKIWGKDMDFSEDLDEAYEYLVNLNDEVFEKIDSSIDEFRGLGSKKDELGFELVCGRKKKEKYSEELGVKVVLKDKKTSIRPKIPFHIPSIKRPQDVYKIVVNNVNQPFQHVWLECSEDGTKMFHPLELVCMLDTNLFEMGLRLRIKRQVLRPIILFHIPSIKRPQDVYKIVVNNVNQPFQHLWLECSEDGTKMFHPLEKYTASDFDDSNVGDIEKGKPLPIESTPFKIVEEVKDLKELVAKLRGVNEFAVDLEHNHYRSFQGLTCLMQISTRTEDFIVDTLKLRVHVGPYLREVFKDPAKKKIMHGADSDILWLQRDFGIYVCNLFDTGQASRVLNLERNSLEYLLNHFCSVTANKEYQQADWRLRPLPAEMVKYAREDTHYLLHIYDLMRTRLLLTSSESGKPDLLLEVYERSYDICMQLYEKELLTESSYLHIYGLRSADFNAQQLAIAQGLCEWRDAIARAEDESTGYILPNKTLLEIAKQMPLSHSKLRQLLNSKHPYIERHLGPVVGIIRHSMQNAAAFEPVVELLKMERLEREEKAMAAEGNEGPSFVPEKLKEALDLPNFSAEIHKNEQGGTPELIQNGSIIGHASDNATAVQRENSFILGQGSGATVQVLKKPTSAFGAMFGNSATKRKLDSAKLQKEEIKLEKIKSSVNLPFHSFVGGTEQSQAEEPAREADTIAHAGPSAAASCSLEDVILLDGESDDSGPDNSETKNEHSEHKETNGHVAASKTDDGDEPMSLSDLSSNFKKCFQSVTQKKAPSEVLQVKPFDYETARNQVLFGRKEKVEVEEGDEKLRKNKFDRKKGSASIQPKREEVENEFAQGKRRQAFPASGNRSATFR